MVSVSPTGLWADSLRPLKSSVSKQSGFSGTGGWQDVLGAHLLGD